MRCDWLQRRKLTERAHGMIKNRGMSRFLVHGREKVRAVGLLQALALNLGWAHTRRRRLLRPRHWQCRPWHDCRRTKKAGFASRHFGIVAIRLQYVQQSSDTPHQEHLG